MATQQRGISIAATDEHFFALIPESAAVAVSIHPVLCCDAPADPERPPDLVVDREGNLRAACILGRGMRESADMPARDVWPALPLEMLHGPHTPRILTRSTEPEEATKHLVLTAPVIRSHSVSGLPYRRVEAQAHEIDSRPAAQHGHELNGFAACQYRGAYGTSLTVWAADPVAAMQAAQALCESPPVDVRFAAGFQKMQCSRRGMPFGSFDDPPKAVWTEQDGEVDRIVSGRLPPVAPRSEPADAAADMARDLAADPETGWPQLLQFAGCNPGASAQLAALLAPAAEPGEIYRTEAAWEQQGARVAPYARGIQGMGPALGIDGKVRMKPVSYYAGSDTDNPPPLTDTMSLYAAFGAVSLNELEDAAAAALVSLRSAEGGHRSRSGISEMAAAAMLIYCYGQTPVRPLAAICDATRRLGPGAEDILRSSLPEIFAHAAGTRDMLEHLKETALSCQAKGQDVTVPKLAAWLAQNARQRSAPAVATAAKKQRAGAER